MEYLKKEASLFDRDENGILIAVVVELEEMEGKPQISVLPIPRGKLQKISAEHQAGNAEGLDDRMVLEHCVNPKYTEEEVKLLKPLMADAITTAIMAISTGRTQKVIREAGKKKALEMEEEYLKKK